MGSKNVLESKTYNGNTVQIIEMDELKGSATKNVSEKLFFYRQSGIKLKMVEIEMTGNSKLTVESGAFYYSKGNIHSNVDIGGAVGVTKKIFGAAMTGESTFKPEYTGRGLVVLEPSFQHFRIIPLNNASITVNKGMYYCSLGDIKVSTHFVTNPSAAILGSEGLTQTRISGTGLAVLQIPVPRDEVIEYKLNNESIKIDGNFCILRETQLKYTVEPSSSTIAGTLVNNEGLIVNISGSGIVWVAPTAPIYGRLQWEEAQDIKNYGMNSKYDSSGNIRK